MAASRIQGITVEIGGDTTKLQTALKGVNGQIKDTQSQLKDVEKLLKLDPTNTELLAQKHRLLGDAAGSTKEKLATLKEAQRQLDAQIASGGEVNQMASEQALYALAAVQRAQTGMPGLYDMTK